MPIVDISHVTWRYHKELEPALKDVSLTVEKGEFLGVMGATGAGKTSLAQTIRGIIPAFYEDGVFEGTVVVDGVNIAESDAQHTAQEIGMVFQDASSQIIGTTVLQDVTFGPANIGLDRRTVLERSRDYLGRVKLAGREHASSSALSGGQIQRLAIAGVLAMEPGVLVLDEPVAELDPVGRREVCAILDELKQSGKATVILIEQDPELVARFAERIVLMADGRIERVGPPREVFRNAESCLSVGVYPPEAALLGEAVLGNRTDGFTPLTAQEFLDLVSLPTALSPMDGLPHHDATPDAPVVLETQMVSFGYTQGQKVLDNVDLAVRAGEYVAIVGSNGAGKTTLTKHFNGLRRPNSGEILVNGRDIASAETADIAHEIGYCFQNPDHQIFASTVLEEVLFGLGCRGIEGEEAQSRALTILEQFGIAGLQDANPHSLGKGQRQKVALASIVVLQPQILVIDEPTTGLDWGECQQILDIIDSIRLQGTTVIAVTHDMRLVRERTSRVVAMSKGRIIFDGPTPRFFLQDDLMRQADVESTTLGIVTRAIAEHLGAEPEQMPVAVDDFINHYGLVLSGKTV